MTETGRLNQAIIEIGEAAFCISAADANLQLKPPKVGVGRLELAKAQARLDAARTVLARLLLDAGGLQRS